MNLNGRKYYKLPGGGGVIMTLAARALQLPRLIEPWWRPGSLGRYYQTSPCAKSAHPSPVARLQMGITRASFPELNSSDSSELRG